MYRHILTLSAHLSLFVILSFSLISQNITGDLFVCKGAQEVYTMPAQSGSNAMWKIIPASGGSIISQNPTEVHIEWSTAPGTYTLRYTTDQGSHDYPVEVEKTVNLACNKTTVVSLDQSCRVKITADLIVEDMQYDLSSYKVILKHKETGDYLPSHFLEGQYVGELMEVSVVQNCTQNNCWGYIMIEDKNTPVLHTGSHVIDCHGDYSPHAMHLFPMQGDIYEMHERTYNVTQHNYCRDMMLSYEDVLSEENCNGEYGQIIYREWTLIPHGGHITNATDTLYMKKASMDEMTFPKDWEGNKSLNCHEAGTVNGWPMLDTGFPSPSYTGSPVGPSCVNLQIKHYDTKFESCNGSSYKLIRKWEVIEWCSGEVVEHDQYIHVQDQKKPVSTIPEYIDVESNWNGCYATIKVPSPEVEDCSDVRIRAGYSYKYKDSSPYQNVITTGVSEMDDSGWFTISDMEVLSEDVWIVYTVSDDCGNSSQAYTTVVLHDAISPVAICDEHTIIGLGTDGYAWADYRALDDGSWDNCAIDSLLVRKLDGSQCDTEQGWAKQVKFCCEDLDQILSIELKVIDTHGNFNICRTTLKVQDNEAPMLMYCPKDTTVTCDFNLTEIQNLKAALFEDFCHLDLSDTIEYNLNECGLGEIVRLFRASDGRGNAITCQQSIIVGQAYDQDSIGANIVWPDDIELDMCEISSYAPEDMAEGYDSPTYSDFSCTEAVVSYEDTKFTNSDDGTCVKILREWSVVDWCQFNPASSFGGTYSHTQVIKLNDLIKPEITFSCIDLEVRDGQPVDGCKYILPTLHADAVDAGCNDSELIWRYSIDFDNNGSTEIVELSDSIASREWPIGRHKVNWIVSDQCGNTAACHQLITVHDNRAPAPFCVTGFSIALNENKLAEIWAEDFNIKSEDECGADSLSFSFSESEYVPSMSLTCEDLQGLAFHLIDVKMYVSDEFGNTAFCNTTINLQGSESVCEDDEARGMVQGQVQSWTGEAVSDVLVKLLSLFDDFEAEQFSDQDGRFSFPELERNKEYRLLARKDSDLSAGLTTADLVQIQQHILGLQTFELPYQIIAADANRSASLTASDIIMLRQRILGLEESTQSAYGWAFIPKSFEFIDPSNPFPIPTGLMIQDWNQAELTEDILAIKIGDVNGSLKANELRSEEVFSLSANLRHDSHVFQLDESIKSVGLQLALRVDGVYDIQLLSDLIGSDEYTIEQKNQQTIIKISWIPRGMVQLLDNISLFELTGIPKGVHISIFEDSFQSELYRPSGITDFEIHNIELQFSENQHSLQVLQNSPNPFSQETRIPVEMEVGGELTLSIIDMSGSIINRQIKYFPSGRSYWTIHSEVLKAEGIYLYQISNDDHLITKKMIMIR